MTAAWAISSSYTSYSVGWLDQTRNMNGEFLDANPADGSVMNQVFSNGGIHLSLRTTSEQQTEKNLGETDATGRPIDSGNCSDGRVLGFTTPTQIAPPRQNGRESVLQRLSEALLRRSLTKVSIVVQEYERKMRNQTALIQCMFSCAFFTFALLWITR